MGKVIEKPLGEEPEQFKRDNRQRLILQLNQSEAQVVARANQESTDAWAAVGQITGEIERLTKQREAALTKAQEQHGKFTQLCQARISLAGIAEAFGAEFMADGRQMGCAGSCLLVTDAIAIRAQQTAMQGSGMPMGGQVPESPPPPPPEAPPAG